MKESYSRLIKLGLGGPEGTKIPLRARQTDVPKNVGDGKWFQPFVESVDDGIEQLPALLPSLPWKWRVV